MASSILTRPALSGFCGVVGCESAADIETVSRRGVAHVVAHVVDGAAVECELTFIISKSCIDHASRGQLDALSAQGLR